MQLRKDVLIPSGIGVVSFGLGMAAGWLLRPYLEKRNLEKKVDELDEGVTQLHFQFIEAKDEMNSVAQTTVAALKDLRNEGRDLLDQVAEEMHRANAMSNHPANGGNKEDVKVNVFPTEEDHWDYEEEEQNRGNPEVPYIIHVDEYFANEKDYQQSTLQYYQGDNIICDETDVPLYNPEKIVGKLMFGHGSNDPNICYVRNEKLEMEWEILLDHGHFQTEVLGHHIEEGYEEGDLHHSLHKFRRD
jgi:hypothetical protein